MQRLYYLNISFFLRFKYFDYKNEIVKSTIKKRHFNISISLGIDL